MNDYVSLGKLSVISSRKERGDRSEEREKKESLGRPLELNTYVWLTVGSHDVEITPTGDEIYG
jgi:hypothetical protein